VPATTYLSLPYPALSAAPNVPQDLQNLAAGVDTKLGGIILCSSGSRPPGRLGAIIYELDSGLTRRHDGTNWVIYNPNALYARKTAFTDKTNDTTLANDPHLTLPVQNGAVYEVTCTLLVHSSSAAGGDLNIRFTGPSGSTLAAVVTAYSTAATANTNVVTSGITLNTTASLGVGVFTAEPWNPVAVQGSLITGGSSGSFTLQWSQATSSAATTRLMDNSSLSLRRVG
jgi:hypothetical protein